MSTLLPPVDAPAPEPSSEELSSRHIEEVGSVAVLGAMVEQRRRSSRPPPPAPGEDDSDAVATQRRERIAPNDDVFQKIR